MKGIIMTNKQIVYLDDEDYQKYRSDTFFYNNKSARSKSTMLLLEQMILGVPKRTKIYYRDGNRLNCCRDNLSLTPFVEEVRKIKSKDFTGVQFRYRPHRYAMVDTPGWYAYYEVNGREQIAGPFAKDEEAAEAYNHLVGKEINKVEPFKPRGGKQPEAIIQDDIIKFLKLRGWWVHVTVMNQMEQGLPDLIALHPKFGIRFIDVKRPDVHSITPAQMEDWPTMHAFGFAPYIMNAATETEYKKLFGRGNYMDYFPKTGTGSRTNRGIMDAYKSKETKKCE